MNDNTEERAVMEETVVENEHNESSSGESAQSGKVEAAMTCHSMSTLLGTCLLEGLN